MSSSSAVLSDKPSTLKGESPERPSFSFLTLIQSSKSMFEFVFVGTRKQKVEGFVLQKFPNASFGGVIEIDACKPVTRQEQMNIYVDLMLIALTKTHIPLNAEHGAKWLMQCWSSKRVFFVRLVSDARLLELPFKVAELCSSQFDRSKHVGVFNPVQLSGQHQRDTLKRFMSGFAAVPGKEELVSTMTFKYAGLVKEQ
uniref:Uncharacterized protein n=1 Tax=Agaricus bisporus virus 6 TaxID=1945750 RepID=A0A1Q1M966_9VIRU|nr:hypothetical protein [Agaricus bisporus virus 6]